MKITSIFKTLPSTVVSNTTVTTSAQADRADGSIKLPQLVDYAVTVNGVETLANGGTPSEQLKALEVARIGWETTELAASNKRLYSILTKAYSFYVDMKTDTDKDARKARLEAMENFIAERGYVFMPSTHDMTRVVKCVFGVDRRRVSAYSIALREALRQEIAAVDLVEFLEENGGVEQIRMGGTKPLSATKRAELVKSKVANNSIGAFKLDATLSGANADWTDKQVIVVATYLPTGEFVANAVIKHDGAVKAALAAYYSNQQAQIREQLKKEKDAAEQEAKAEKEASAQLKLQEQTKAKEEKTAKHLAKMAAEKAEAERIAKNTAQLNTLLVEAIA